MKIEHMHLSFRESRVTVSKDTLKKKPNRVLNFALLQDRGGRKNVAGL